MSRLCPTLNVFWLYSQWIVLYHKLLINKMLGFFAGFQNYCSRSFSNRRCRTSRSVSNQTVKCRWNFRSQNRNRGGVLPVRQRARPHLHNALQVRQAERDLLQVCHRGSAEVWARARAPNEEQGRGHHDSGCELWKRLFLSPLHAKRTNSMEF